MIQGGGPFATPAHTWDDLLLATIAPIDKSSGPKLSIHTPPIENTYDPGKGRGGHSPEASTGPPDNGPSPPTGGDTAPWPGGPGPGRRMHPAKQG